MIARYGRVRASSTQSVTVAFNILQDVLVGRGGSRDLVPMLKPLEEQGWKLAPKAKSLAMLNIRYLRPPSRDLPPTEACR